jgi:hypothetical protein
MRTRKICYLRNPRGIGSECDQTDLLAVLACHFSTFVELQSHDIALPLDFLELPMDWSSYSCFTFLVDFGDSESFEYARAETA